jgi:hypothetical protein
MNSGPGVGSLMYFLSQLGYQGPVLFVYLVAGYFSIMYMNRARLPSMLTLIGVIILLATTFGVTGAQFYLLNNRSDSSFPQLFQIINLIGSCMRAVGIGLFVAAIFVERNYTPPDERYLRE